MAPRITALLCVLGGATAGWIGRGLTGPEAAAPVDRRLHPEGDVLPAEGSHPVRPQQHDPAIERWTSDPEKAPVGRETLFRERTREAGNPDPDGTEAGVSAPPSHEFRHFDDALFRLDEGGDPYVRERLQWAELAELHELDQALAARLQGMSAPERARHLRAIFEDGGWFGEQLGPALVEGPTRQVLLDTLEQLEGGEHHGELLDVLANQMMRERGINPFEFVVTLQVSLSSERARLERAELVEFDSLSRQTLRDQMKRSQGLWGDEAGFDDASMLFALGGTQAPAEDVRQLAEYCRTLPAPAARATAILALATTPPSDRTDVLLIEIASDPSGSLNDRFSAWLGLRQRQQEAALDPAVRREILARWQESGIEDISTLFQ